MLYWQIGTRIHKEILGDRRAKYGQQIVHSVSGHLTGEYGQGFTKANLLHMMRFAEAFPEPQIVYTLCRQLSWSHFRLIIYLRDPLQREFYAEMCRIERWSVRTLQKKIGGMLYERTALSKKPAKLVALELKQLREEDKLTPDLVFRDPYFLDFLKLKGAYQEKDLEAAILREMQDFILELGAGFAFVARQKRIQVGTKDYYLDLLFYQRRLRRLVAIELKLEDFKPEFKGQMEFYLCWLEKHEVAPGEKTPIGLILCAGRESEAVELLQLDKSGIRVAQYMTDLPPSDILAHKLRDAIRQARQRLASQAAKRCSRRSPAG
jgi:predicted nuclease of restriction endonuclease-like (RecB) superfamily